jgi:hypothetical protein
LGSGETLFLACKQLPYYHVLACRVVKCEVRDGGEGEEVGRERRRRTERV